MSTSYWEHHGSCALTSRILSALMTEGRQDSHRKIHGAETTETNGPGQSR